MPNNPEIQFQPEQESPRKAVRVVVLDDNPDNSENSHVPNLVDEGILREHISICLDIDSALQAIDGIRNSDPVAPVLVLLDHNLGLAARLAKKTGETAFNLIKDTFPEVHFGGISTDPQAYLDAGSCLRYRGPYSKNLREFLDQHFPKS